MSFLTQAIKTHKMFGYPHYVWISYGWYHDEWWKSTVNMIPIRCSEAELAELLRLSITIETDPVPDSPDTSTDVQLVCNIQHVSVYS